MTATTSSTEHEKLITLDHQVQRLTNEHNALQAEVTEAREALDSAALEGRKLDTKHLAALETKLREAELALESHQRARDRQSAVVAEVDAGEPARRRERFEGAIQEPAERLNQVVEDLLDAVNDCVQVHIAHQQPVQLERLLAAGSMTERGARVSLVNSALTLRNARAKFTGGR